MNLDFEDKFRGCIKKIGDIGNLYAEAKGQSWQMQEMKGSVLASLINSLEGPVTQREITAKASDDYKKHLSETAQAIKKELQLKSQYEMWKASFEALRSLSSLEKATQKEIR